MNPNQNSNQKRVTFASGNAITRMMESTARNSLTSGFGARSSLATIPQGQQNSLSSRPSNAPGGTAGSLSGKQSLFNVGGEVAKRIPAMVKPNLKDSRNLVDKAVVTNICNKVFDFLSRLEAPFQFTEKTIRQPTGKADFKNIFEFIFRRIDEKYVLKLDSLEKEVPNLLIALGYPYPIKSHHLQPMGASHSWPHVLGALVWLIDVVEAENNHDAESVKDELAYSYVFACFKKKLQAEKMGKSQPVEILDFNEELKEFRQLMMDKEHLDVEFRELNQRRTEHDNAIEQIRKDVEEDQQDIHELEGDIGAMISDIAKLKSYVEQILSSITRVEENILEDEKGIEKLTEKLAEIDGHNEKKEMLIQAQTMSGDEARALILKRSTLKEQLSSCRVQLHKMEMKYYELHPQFFKESGRINAEYQTFISCLREFCNSLNVLSKSEELDWTRYNYDLSSDEFVNNARNELTDLLAQLKNEVSKTIENFRESLANADLQIEEKTREVQKLEDEKSKAKLENNLKLEQKARQNEDFARKLQAQTKELELVRSQHSKVKDELSTQNSAVDQARDKFLAAQEKYANQCNALEKIYNDVLTAVVDCANKLHSRFNYLQKTKFELKQLGEGVHETNQKELMELKRRKMNEDAAEKDI